MHVHVMMYEHVSYDISESGKINPRSDPKELGPKTSLPMHPYLQCVRARAQKLMMPYVAVLPVIVEPTTEEGIPYTILYPYMPTSLGEL